MGDSIGFLAAFLTTTAFLPQAVLTLRTRKTDELSLGMYVMFCTGVLFWLIYGLSLGNAAITAANAFTLLLALPILAIKLRNVISGRDKTP